MKIGSQAIFTLLLVAQLVICAPVGNELVEGLARRWEDEQTENPNGAIWEQGEHFEGDMVLSGEQKRALEEAMEGNYARNGLLGVTKRWPDNVVVYDIRKNDFDHEQIRMIEEGLEDIANQSCIRFHLRREEKQHAVVIQGTASGCFSNVGFVSDEEEGDQTLNLAKGCFRHGTVVHEMLHTLGFYHMQSTYDRDDYVIIHWQHILEGTEHNFAKYNNDTVTDFGVSYDYDSVMHYPANAFTKNGNKTIEPLQANVTIGQRHGMSDKDVLKLKRMYCGKSIDNKINHSF